MWIKETIPLFLFICWFANCNDWKTTNPKLIQKLGYVGSTKLCTLLRSNRLVHKIILAGLKNIKIYILHENIVLRMDRLLSECPLLLQAAYYNGRIFSLVSKSTISTESTIDRTMQNVSSCSRLDCFSIFL